MAQKPEAKYKAKVHRLLPVFIHHQGMYTPFSAGTPDHWYSSIEGDLWIEYKWLSKIPKTLHLCNPDIKYPLLTSKQQQWLRGRYNEGRKVAVVTATPDGAVIFKNLAWETPMDKEIFLAQSVTHHQVAEWIIETVALKKYISKKKEIVPL